MRILSKEEIAKVKPYYKDFSEGEKIHYLYSMGYHDITFFSDYFLYHWKLHNKTNEFIDTPEFHRQIWSYLSRKINLNIIIARGHGKTTATLIWILHALLYKTEKSLLYVACETLGKVGITKIKNELEENELIKSVFGEMKPTKIYKKKGDDGGRWTISILELSNGTRIETKTPGQAVRGGRYTKILFDDPQENKDVENKEVVDRFNNWAFTSLFNTMLPGSSMAVLGTIIGNLCFVKFLRDTKKWYTIEYEACNNEFENILWDGMWSKESLMERRDGSIITDEHGNVIGREAGIGSACFNQEFRNIPLNKENAVIKEEWIRYYDYDVDFKRLAVDYENIIMAIDPATSTKESKTGDSSGICVVGIKDENCYVLYAQPHKLSSLDLVDECERIFNLYNPGFVIFEKNKEETIGVLLQQRELPIIMEHAIKDKMTRLLSQQYKFQNGQVFFPKNGDCDEAIYQLTNFPDVVHDDIMDSVVYCLAFDKLSNKVSINTDIGKTITGNIFNNTY